LNRSHRQTLGYRVLASAMTAPLFEFYYQVIEAGLICVVNHSLGFIHCRKVTLFRSFLGPVATVADHVADYRQDCVLPMISFLDWLRPKQAVAIGRLK
jgi:hypothetical protein